MKSFYSCALNPFHIKDIMITAVDIVGQAGKPKTITGFQTHVTPVLLSHTDRAEMATEEYISVNDTLEGNKKAIEELKNIYKQNDELKSQDDIGNYILNEINEQNNEQLKKKKKEKEMEKKKDKSFILNLLTNIDETKENEQDIKLKEELKNYVNLNSLCSYHFDENNKYDNYLTPTFPN
ncbi:hypothetical protein PFNF54_00211 [Plasmodium falciparum NF54]|uniref:26S proteasome non-ATPase regulatory subunit RPN1 C-terminal domain-containing protein n=1 Tax=Plasmodium falciparum (isolate NF54) TaxID=5843 RepID=W7K246_PLAFO|nr:hypothetical protein PFNF54_00211 [Plasmodium falciparum NF54]